MLNKETREVLKSLTGVSNAFILDNQTTITDEFKQIICSVNLEKLGEDFKEKIGISEMTNFLNAVNLIQDPEIGIKNRIINIKNDKSKIKYLSSDLKSMQETDYKVVERTKAVNTVTSFKVTKDLIDMIKKGVSVFNTFDTLFITKKDDNITLSLGIENSFNSSSNEFSIEIPDHKSTGNDFVVKLPIQGFLKIPVTEYDLDVKYNAEKDSYRIYMSNSLIEIVMSTIK